MSEESGNAQTKPLKRVEEGNRESGENGHIRKKLKSDVEQTGDERKLPKRKVVLLLAYSGKGYYGMQVGINPLNLSINCIPLRDVFKQNCYFLNS